MTKLRGLFRRLEETGAPYEIQRSTEGDWQFLVRLGCAADGEWQFVRDAPTLKGAIRAVLADRDAARMMDAFDRLKATHPEIEKMRVEMIDGIVRSAIQSATAGVEMKHHQPHYRTYRAADEGTTP